MKNLLAVILTLSFPFFLFSQNKVVVKLTVKQLPAITVNYWEDPDFVGDESKFDITGGTGSYSIGWEQVQADNPLHKVTIKDDNNCSAEIYVNVGSALNNVEELSLIFNAYPNPTADIVNVPLSANEAEQTIMLFDENGRMLYRKKINDRAISTYRLSLAACAPGCYYIQVVATEKKSYKVVKK
ncbi:T9SS C-terminal target domain-containing protein [Paludibacter sp. 221]|uniref:T9SS type A sorting domain-containing protein n=1 Tax=Paludibacter sp. 221 TaxID=2302939 RepID=UPI0013D1EA7D|nr:T9SS type A sorting domain-containing protein [Paludibacter sp. 221]NDV46890.1 T9SS C-terminal target domain-containing protein [Paludibacter sp. 221]